ncbi:MAG: 2-polyprenylphenol 6-hydroxylase [Rhodospirillaceae bacterium]|nr:2-polyprenylphenol 6-hydroxylase [Rhodospirillaceae bacterium]
MFTSLSHIARLIGIARVLAKHDALLITDGIFTDIHPLTDFGARAIKFFWRPLPEVRNLRTGQRLSIALEKLGPTFIKFGQALSTRSDLLGEEVAADLAELQDRLAPFPFAEAEQQIVADFGKPLSALYTHFDPVPVAAASIAQVHFATTTEGQDVAVKVLRPDVRHAFARDIGLLYWLADSAVRARPQLARLKPREVVATFENTTRLEMDFRFEAAAAQEVAENFANDPMFKAPAVDWQRTSERILTLERVGGLRVDDRAAIEAAGLDAIAVVKTAAEVFFNMVFRDGFFHADMHPGNLFITPVDNQPGGKVIAIDFGIMGRIDRETQRTLADMLLGFLTRDYKKVAQVHIDAGFVPAHKSADEFAQAARSIAEPILGKPIAEISLARLLGQLFQVTEQFEMQTQPQLLLLQKSMLVAEGVGRTLAPETNMWELAQPLIERWMRDQLGPEARVIGAAESALTTIAKVPRIINRLDAVTADLAANGLKLHPQSAEAMRGNGGWGRWLPWAVIAGLLIALLVQASS